ncbi:MAG: hypothetical protein A2X39_04960 [Elusimicrobia bacterium GWC2_56_31]|nr:MAG: hypothetical protein A2X39_04960 [Elusimicrobia bacterium GWC2_56_31]HBB67682.1 hypothetical protein [Elusimicrobiota bacterium]HBW22864.1 hypothetical protein [Elusimicrobiota bacterium]
MRNEKHKKGSPAERRPDFNIVKGSFDRFPVRDSLELFRRMCLVKYFEEGLIRAVESKRVVCPLYLSSGQESAAAALSFVARDYQIFAQHRAHDIFLCFGGEPARLRDELLGLPTGLSRGKAGSNCLQYHKNGLAMYGHHGLIGENVPMGVGAALANGKNTLCVFGDGAAEEDYVLSSLGFASTHKLPVLFVCVDNDLSILTPTAERRNWKITDVAGAMGLGTVDAADDPWSVIEHSRKLSRKLPALINVRTCRKYWHVGVGNDGASAWDRYAICKEKLIGAGQLRTVTRIENAMAGKMRELWAN